jgi:hypothetical protein
MRAGRVLRWGATVAVTGAVLLLVAGAGRVGAQVPPITVPGQTTTTAAPPPTTEAPPTTGAPSPTTTEAPVGTTPTSDVTQTTDTLAPDVPVPSAGASTSATTATTPATTSGGRPTAPAVVDLASGIRPAAVTGAYGLGLAALIAVAVLLIALTTHLRTLQLRPAGQLRPGGNVMNATRRARLIAGFSCLALAAIVGLVGYLKLSLEPDVNRQIPYLASAGMALVLLSALGGALVVGEQMRTDEQRIGELEAAVQSLAAIVSPSVEAPPRHTAPAVVESAAADAAEAAEAAASTGSGRKPGRRRS